MTKKGFTLMELLVSIFITGMVMLSLVAMWKTSSNHTAQAQRQAVIKNENTIFLRSFYNDFVSASEVLCPSYINNVVTFCNSLGDNYYVALKEAVINDEAEVIVRRSRPLCGAGGNSWGTGANATDFEQHCMKPSFVVYKFINNGVYKCQDNFLDSTNIAHDTITLGDFKTQINNKCNNDKYTLLLPYAQAFTLSIPATGSGADKHFYPELLIDYTVRKEFSSDVPPVYFKMKRYFVKKGGGIL